jgi:hypothetical protein
LPRGFDFSDYSGDYVDSGAISPTSKGDNRPVYTHTSNSAISLRFIYHPALGDVWQLHHAEEVLSFDGDSITAKYSMDDLYLE